MGLGDVTQVQAVAQSGLGDVRLATQPSQLPTTERLQVQPRIADGTQLQDGTLQFQFNNWGAVGIHRRTRRRSVQGNGLITHNLAPPCIYDPLLHVVGFG